MYKIKRALYNSNMIVIVFLSVVFSLLIVGCSKNNDSITEPDNITPRTNIPSNLAREWYSGNISSINFFNSTTGQFSSPSGVGMYFKFSTDGYYEKGVILQSSSYECSSTFYAFNKGTVVIDDNKIILYPVYGHIKSEDNCVSSNNYEKPDQLSEETMIWQLGVDEYHSETLWLNYEGGNPSAFHIRN